MIISPEDEARARARKSAPPPAKEGPIVGESHLVWWNSEAFTAFRSEHPSSTIARVKVDLPVQIGTARERAWPEINQARERFRAVGCEVFCVHAYGHTIGTTTAVEGHWWLDVLVPPGARPINSGARPW